MTRAEREQLMERYLQGAMSASEEHDFFIEAATDKELRFDLRASRIVESAFSKDKEGAPTSYGAMRDHLAGLLTAEEAATQGSSSTAAKQAGRSAHLGWIMAAASIGLISLAALLIGIVAIDRSNPQELTTPPALIEARHQSDEVQMPAPQLRDAGRENNSSVGTVSSGGEESRLAKTKPDITSSPGNSAQTSQGNLGQTQEANSTDKQLYRPSSENITDTTNPNMKGRIVPVLPN